jgi:5-methylcytosine-specific restriction endonuclease McrA
MERSRYQRLPPQTVALSPAVKSSNRVRSGAAGAKNQSILVEGKPQASRGDSAMTRVTRPSGGGGSARKSLKIKTNKKRRNMVKKNIVHVLNVDGTPLMPCLPVVTRLLLKVEHARVVRITPFTIRLTREPETKHVKELTLGVDAGSRKAGFGVTDEKGNVYYTSEIEIRQDIKKKMDRRRTYRRSRRNRKCRYRKCRFLNRRNSIRKGRLPPSLRSKIESHLREIKFIKNILPVEHIIIEAGTFDPHALKDPTVLVDSTRYQHGTLYGYANVKAFVRYRDKYTCHHCKGKSGDRRLHCHHVVFHENGGSNEPENLVVLCETCHLAFHRGEFELRLTGKRKGSLNHPTHLNIINKRLLKRVPGSIETFGYVTKTDREQLKLQKTHYLDALVIATRGIPLTFKNDVVLIKRHVANGDYQRTKGIRSQMTIPKGKIHGYLKFDKVRYRGKTCFIKGRRSTGYFVLMDISGSAIPLKHA